MESYHYITIAAEVMSIIVCSVLLYGNIFETKNRTKRNTFFSFMIGTEMLALIVDVYSWFVDEQAELVTMELISTEISTLMSYVLLAEYGMYIYYFLLEKKKISKRPFQLFLVFCACAILVTLVCCLMGEMYFVDDGSLEYGLIYDIYTVANIAGMIFCATILLYYRNLISRHDLAATLLYIAIPVVCAAMNFMDENLELAYPAVTISLLILYVMIQEEKNNKLSEEKEKANYYALHDEMTGLLSRRAYTQKLDELEKTESTIGVIFGDINGLKYENDHFGHEAGDRLIIRMADSLCKYFRKEEIYRISGDEFVVLLPGILQDNFEKRISELQKTLNFGQRALACLGAEYGSCGRVNELIRMAETHMYDDKDIFYKQYPELKR